MFSRRGGGRVSKLWALHPRPAKEGMSRESRVLSLVVELDSGEAVSGASGRIQPGAFGLTGYERESQKANCDPCFDVGIREAPGRPGEEGTAGDF